MADKPSPAKRWILRVLSLLLPALLFVCAGVLCSCGEGKTDYIVKIRGSDAPFDVVSLRELKRMLRADEIEWYEPDGEAVLLGTISPYYDDTQWGLDMIGADAAFRQGFTGKGVRVGVLDSGVNAHPDLEGRLLPGRCYITDTPDPDNTADTYNHGTRIAGLIAGVSGEGYLGAAPDAQIVPLKITDGKAVQISALCAAIYGAIDDYGCTVLNLSLGVQTDYTALREAVEYAESKNVVVVSAAGNNGTEALFYPAAYESVIGVGAVDSGGRLYYHSNHNESVFLSAPGAEVRTLSNLGGYTFSSGTSFAVAYVSAAAAVMRSMEPGLTAADIRSILASTASDTGDAGYDEYFGYGVLNLAGCVEEVKGGETVRDEPGEVLSFLPGTGAANALRNNTGKPVACIYYLAYYSDSGVCLRVESAWIDIPAGETVPIAGPDETLCFGQFACEAETMIPLASARTNR